MNKENAGFMVEVWDDKKGVRFKMGPHDRWIACELLLGTAHKPSVMLEHEGGLDDFFFEEEGIDGEKVQTAFFAHMEPSDLRAFCKRTLAMLEGIEDEPVPARRQP